MNKACCFTGHRKINYEEALRLADILPFELEQLATIGYDTFYAGGAIGFDTLAAQAVLKLRESRPNIMLRLLLPCQSQEEKWSLHQKREYYRIIEEADTIEYLAQTCSSYAMRKRNKALVDNSDYCLCYLDHERSGTAYTVKYAEQKGLTAKNLHPSSSLLSGGILPEENLNIRIEGV